MSARGIVLSTAAVLLPVLYASLFLACDGLPYQDLPINTLAVVRYLNLYVIAHLAKPDLNSAAARSELDGV